MASIFDQLGMTDPTPDSTPREDDLFDHAVKLTGEQFCQAIVNSKEYRLSLVRRVIDGNLAPAVECRIMDNAWGKVTERVEVKDTTNDMSHISAQKLEERAAYLLETARSLRQREEETEAIDEDSEQVH